jgi:hypothetical protein
MFRLGQCPRHFGGDETLGRALALVP